MSKYVNPDHAFDADRFSELLELAQGNRSQFDFARACSLTAPYISKLKNHRLQAPPTPSTVRKIYSGAMNGVTLESLLYAAGYAPAKYTSVDTDPKERSKRLVLAAITASLSESKFDWQKNTLDNTDYLFSINVIGGQISTWNFIYISHKSIDAHQNETYGWLSYYYLKLMTSHTKLRTKFSFVTDSEDIFNMLVNSEPYMLAMYVSVILLDLSSLSIRKEKYLDTILLDGENIDEISILC